MTPIERIDQYLNNQLPTDEVTKLERELRQNPELQELLDTVEMTRRTIRTQAIRAEVRQVHGNFMADYRRQVVTDQETGNENVPVVPLHGRRAGNGWVMRVAATVLLAAVGYTGYQFATLNHQAVYDDNFVEYRLPTIRDADARQSIPDSLYRAGNYAAVVQQVASIAAKERLPRQYFLAAMSHLQLRQYKAALAQFQALKNSNSRSVAPVFEQEADYYGALANLGAGNYEHAYSSLKSIHDNPRHLFQGNVSTVNLWKIKLLAYK